MELQQLSERANALGIYYPAGVSKAKLVRAIQRRLGQPACFAGDESFTCEVLACEWRTDCWQPIAEWRR